MDGRGGRNVSDYVFVAVGERWCDGDPIEGDAVACVPRRRWEWRYAQGKALDLSCG